MANHPNQKHNARQTLMKNRYDAIIIGASAAGLMCAIEAGKRGRRVLVIDHANKVGKKILLSGGGRCNFTNRHASPSNYLSNNKHFCISALKRYSQYDFEQFVQDAKINYYEKTLGQLFCCTSSKEIVQLLLSEIDNHDITIQLKTSIQSIQQKQTLFCLETTQGKLQSESLVIATGGLSFPTMGASAFGYKLAEQFGLRVLPVRAGLVPLTLHKKDLEKFTTLPGVAVNVTVSSKSGASFTEAMLFTHRGLSGPAILQISSYWQPGEEITINFFPEHNKLNNLLEQQARHPNSHLKTVLNQHLPSSLVKMLCTHDITNKPMKRYSSKDLDAIIRLLTTYTIRPAGTEGYRTAEVTLGGVDSNELSSKTFESKKTPGLFFIGEVIDVTGHLGGFNFQWAWSSGYCCGQVI
jgi:predicted Rossmann fold flavoprotein